MTTGSGWLSRLVQRFTGVAATDNPLLEFESEADRESRLAPSRPPGRRLWRTFVIAAALFAIAGIGISRWPWIATRAAGAEATDNLSSFAINTTPQGAQVIVDGEPRGVTPLTLVIAPGSHAVTVRAGTLERNITINAKAGGEIVRDIEFPSNPVASATAALTVTSDPQGARVAIDGRFIGVTPITVGDLPAGRHRVTATSTSGNVERQIDLQAGENSSVVFSLAKTADAGWVQIAAPFDVQLIERGEVIGTSATPRMMLTAGTHDLLIVNRSLEFQDARRIDVKRGETTRVGVEPQEVRININARPWAEVSVDGQSLGETPIANTRVLVGTRRLVFRHPDLGERQETVVVTTKPGQRFSVDLTK
jgi:hypothetical protein